MELPSTLESLLQSISVSVKDLPSLIQGRLDQTKLSSAGKHAVQYSVPGVIHGRPLSEVLILLAGETGTGKSTTINTLFDDPALCKVSDSKSETSEIHQCTRNLNVTSVAPAIKAQLTLVDVPGFVDTNHKKEQTNVAKFLNFRKTHLGLKSRSIPTTASVLARSHVYPNLILFVFNAADERLEGPDSGLSKSLKMLHDTKVVDGKFNNLLAVGTHAGALKRSKDKYQQQALKATTIVQNAVRDILGVRNVQVVFVENDPEEYGLKKPSGSDFFQLPDGSLSHCTLIQAMFKIFTASGDKLGLLLTSWYFKSNCPDKKSKPISKVYKPPPQTFDEDVNAAAESIQKNLHIKDVEIVPVFNFHSLGYAFCPVTEVQKSHMVLTSSSMVTLTVGKSKFLVPSFVKHYKTNKSEFRKLSYETKSAYESAKTKQYGLELGLNLKVQEAQGGVSGSWSSSSSSSSENIEISLAHEISLAEVHVDSPERYISKELTNALQGLPSSYSGHEDKYNELFSKFGTHLINKLHFGGYIQIDCTFQGARYNSKSESELHVALGGIFKKLSLGASYDTSSGTKQLESIGISKTRISISGGSPPSVMIRTLEDLTPAIYKQWVESVETNPTELPNFSLYAFYNLSQCPNSGQVKEATKEFLEQTLESKLLKKRDEIASQGQKDAQTPTGGSSCFPASTMVQIWNQSRENIVTTPICKLAPHDLLVTMKRSGHVHGGRGSTSFATFLHKEPHNIAEFLCFRFENGKSLRVTADHLMLVGVGARDNNSQNERRRLQSVLAHSVQIGDTMAYLGDADAEQVTWPHITEIIVERHVGIFCPLTNAGTFVANGFLVTCYADINSFLIADTAMWPLKLWQGAKHLWSANLKKRGQEKEPNNDDNTCGDGGIHEYAKGLMKLRKVFKYRS